MTSVLDSDRKAGEVASSSSPVLSTMVEHWIKSRVDTPGQVVGRLDDAAKQLLVVAGILQGVLVAIVKLAPSTVEQLSGFSIAAMIFLVITAFFAMLTLCVQSGYLDTEPLYKDFRQSPDETGTLSIVDRAIKRWCESHDRVRFWKRLLLGFAMMSLVTSMSFSVVCVWHAIHHSTAVTTPTNAGVVRAG